MPGSCCLPVLCADHQRVCAAGRAWDSCSCYLPFTIHWWGLHAGEAPLCQRLGQPQRHVHPCVLAQLWMDQATRNMIEQDKYQLYEPLVVLLTCANGLSLQAAVPEDSQPGV